MPNCSCVFITAAYVLGADGSNAAVVCQRTEGTQINIGRGEQPACTVGILSEYTVVY